MKLYNMYFLNVTKDYNPERLLAVKKNKHGADGKLVLNNSGCYTAMEDELKKYWEYGGGVEKIVFAGEIDDALFKPTLTDHDFVDEQIKSKKNGETVGYQG
jgi:hypothetical protein